MRVLLTSDVLHRLLHAMNAGFNRAVVADVDGVFSPQVEIALLPTCGKSHQIFGDVFHRVCDTRSYARNHIPVITQQSILNGLVQRRYLRHGAVRIERGVENGVDGFAQLRGLR